MALPFLLFPKTLAVLPPPDPPPIIATTTIEVKYEETVDPSFFCNCYKSAEVFSGIDLPPMAKLVPNTSEPMVGSFLITNYYGLKHVAVVTEVKDDGVSVYEANYKHCQESRRFIPYTYEHIVGFYTPG